MFPKGRRFQEKEPEQTPGPTAYSLKASLLHEDPNKHFGFIEKSRRFKELQLAEENGENVNPDTNSTNPNVAAKSATSAKPSKPQLDESFKLKKEIDRLQEIIERQTMNQQKEMQLLDDKMHKLDSHLQLALKEKNALISANIHKDKEIANLLHTQTALKANLEKSEKISMNYHDKVAKTVTLQKKAVTLEKKNNLMKDAVEKRLSTEERLLKENEDYVAELKDLSEKYSRAEVDVASLTATSSSLRIQLDQIESAHDKHILQLKQEYEAIISGNQASLQECQDNIVLLNGCVAELKSEKGDLAAKCVEGDSLLQKSQSLYSSLSSGFQSILSLAGISSSSALLESETAIHTVVSSFKNTFETMTASQQQSAELIDSLKAEKSILVGQGVQMRSEIEYLTDAVSVVQMEKTNLAEGASKDRQLFEEKETENKTALAQMAAQMVALNSSIQEKEDKIQTLSSTTMIASETTKKLKIDIEELDLKMSAERQQLNSKIDAQASNLLEKDGRIAQLESLLVQSGSEIDNLLQTKQDLENKYSSLESQLESAHKQLLATEQELTGNAQTLESQLKTQLCLVAELTSLTRGQDQELAASLDRINLLDQEVHDKTTRLESLVADLENVNREISTLQAANQDLMSIKINLESLLADKVAGIDSAASTIQDLSGKLDSAQLETATLLSQVDRLNVTCKVMSEDVSSLTQRLEESNQSNKHLEASLSSLESKLVESERQAQALAQDLKSESEAKCTLLTQFEELTTTSQQQKDSLEQTVSSLENIMSNRESQYRKSLEELNEKIDSDTVNFSQMRARLEMDLKEEKDRVSQLEADILDKEAVFTKTLLVERQRYASLEQTSLESCQDLQDKMDRDVTRFTTTITQLNEKIKENEVVVDALNKQVEETHSLTTAEITSLKEQLLQANAQFEEMVVAEKRKMDQTVCEYEQRVKAFESEVSSLQIASSDFKQSALTKEKEIQLLQERISLMQEETKQVEEARIYQLNELMASKQHADQRVLELETQTTQLDQTNCQLTSALEKKEVELVGMKGVLVGLESRLAQEIQQLTSEKQALIEKVSQQQQTMDKFSSNTKDLEEKLQDMSREREHSEKNSIALELKIKEFVEKLHVERETNKQTLSAYQSKYEEIALLLRKETERADKVEKERNATMEKLKFIQLTHSNEVGGRDIRIRSLEDQIKEKSKLLEARAAAFEETEKMRVEREEMLKEMEWARSRVQESEEKMAMIQTTWRNEKKDLEHEIERRRADIKGFTVDIEKLRQKNVESEMEFNRRLEEAGIEIKKAKAKEQVATTELMKLSDEQSEILGHHNSKQKIRHVSQLKEENINLKKEMMAAKLQKDEYKRRVLSLERDLEAYKSVGGKPPMSRVQRAIKTAFGEQQGHDTLADLTELCIAAEDKENTSATYSTDINNIV